MIFKNSNNNKQDYLRFDLHYQNNEKLFCVNVKVIEILKAVLNVSKRSHSMVLSRKKSRWLDFIDWFIDSSLAHEFPPRNVIIWDDYLFVSGWMWKTHHHHHHHHSQSVLSPNGLLTSETSEESSTCYLLLLPSRLYNPIRHKIRTTDRWGENKKTVSLGCPTSNVRLLDMWYQVALCRTHSWKTASQLTSVWVEISSTEPYWGKWWRSKITANNQE